MFLNVQTLQLNKMETFMWADTHFTAIHKKLETTKILTVEGWLGTAWGLHSIEYYTAI